MAITPLYIFDLDGTLSDTTHRQGILNTDDPDKWDKFYDACDGDTPKTDVIDTLRIIFRSGSDVFILTGRSDAVREKTVDWLVEHQVFARKDLVNFPELLVMREDGDHTHDHIFKAKCYDNMLHVDQERLVAVFEDRDRVVNMWRDKGVPCYQVAEGDF